MFTKGISGNPKGRPKGAVSTLPRLTRAIIESPKLMDAFQKIGEHLEGLEVDIQKVKTLESRCNLRLQYIRVLSDLLPYFIPKEKDTDDLAERIADKLVTHITVRPVNAPPEGEPSIPENGSH